MVNQQAINIQGQEWPLQQWGRGKHLLLALHGFAENAGIFEKWRDQLGDLYTIVAADLPFHGAAYDWTGSDFGPGPLARLIAEILKNYDQSDYILLGHSYGARLIIASWDRLEKPPAAIWLLAPDGLATRRMATVGALPRWFRKWVAGGIERRHGLWINLAGRLGRLGLVDAFSVRYLKQHLADPLRRRRLMGTWRSLPNFPVRRGELLSVAKQKDPPIHLVIGRRDKLIDWERLSNWLEKWPEEQLHLLDTGHQLITDQTAELIRKVSSVDNR